MSSAAQEAWLNRYEVLGKLGEGGYGAVYEALDRSTGERVALKELTRVNPTTLARFKQEFRAVQEIHHPNLVRLDALFEDRGKWMIAMELVDGSELLTYLYAAENELGFRQPQLRDVFGQLADALLALHGAGFVHLDLKPSNVRVTPEGRVVLLDFGLTTALDEHDDANRAAVAGTVAYMSPEQASDRPLGPAADWYSFGVCLFEAMTGLLPIDAENAGALLQAKQSMPAPRASSQAPGLPADLDALCAQLLRLDPATRPSGPAIRGALGSGTGGEVPSEPAARPSKPPFEGRESELGVLADAIDRARAGQRSMVLVDGDSGIGKSALIKHFLDQLEQKAPAPLSFRSRCYENELLAFKAFDGAVDGIARVLTQLDAAECAALLPPHAALLCRVFPALASVKALSDLPLVGFAADPAAQRLEAFGLFALLLARLSQRTPIVITIDDLQWADTESFRLLQALLSDAQPSRLLVLATLRPNAELEGDAAREIAALRKHVCVNELSLRGLPRPQARALARDLMGPAIPDSWLDVVVRESAGHPLFLTVLARFAESHDPKTAAELTLDAAIASRIGALPRQARRLLETVALVGSPLSAPVCGAAAGLGESDRRRLIAELCNQKLLRRRGAGDVACFHDRIRKVAVEYLPRVEARQVHARIAAALATQRDTDAALLARHHEAAGELEPAYRAYRRAAERALLFLAFARAAALYQRALDVSRELPLPDAERGVLHTARGHALARDGRSAEAAEQYLAAARLAAGEEQTRLRLWAAQHLLQSAHVEAGTRAARELLSELGLPWPRHAAASVGGLLWDRTLLNLRGRQVRPTRHAIASRDRMRLDALWGLTLPVSWCDPLAGVALSTRHLRLACALGEPAHVSRALSMEAFNRAFLDADAGEIDALLARSRQLAQGETDPAIEVSLSFHEATVATWRWDLRLARERLEHAQKVGTEGCPDQPWLLTNVRTNLLSVWANVGEHARLASSCNAWLAEARERNDKFTQTVLEGLGFGSYRHLMVDDPDLARLSLDAAMAPWPREPFGFAQMGELVGVTYTELYRGGDGLSRWLERERPRLSRAFMLKRGFGKATLLMYRSLAALAALGAADGAARAALLPPARAIVARLGRVKSMPAPILARACSAQLAAISGERAAALAEAREVRRLSRERGYDLEPRFAYLEGLLEGGEAGRQKQAAALQFFAERGWKKPRRAIAMLCPGIDALER